MAKHINTPLQSKTHLTPLIPHVSMCIYTDLFSWEDRSHTRFSQAFKNYIYPNRSSVKIPNDVDRDDPELRKDIHWTKALDSAFAAELEADPEIRWQYFGSSTGAWRLYPGLEQANTFYGMPTDFDARARPWYVAAASGPKDVVIHLDCSSSMGGNRWAIATKLVKLLINTLTKDDYFTVVCARYVAVGMMKLVRTEAVVVEA